MAIPNGLRTGIRPAPCVRCVHIWYILLITDGSKERTGNRQLSGNCSARIGLRAISVVPAWPELVTALPPREPPCVLHAGPNRGKRFQAMEPHRRRVHCMYVPGTRRRGAGAWSARGGMSPLALAEAMSRSSSGSAQPIGTGAAGGCYRDGIRWFAVAWFRDTLGTRCVVRDTHGGGWLLPCGLG